MSASLKGLNILADMNKTNYNFPSLPLKEIQSNLFANRTNKNKANTIKKEYSLLNDSTLKSLSHTNAEVMGIKIPKEKLGEGSYGYVTSAVIDLEYKTKVKKLVSAVKVSMESSRYGVPADIILECSVYARLLKSNNTSKALFASLIKGKSSIIMEHYSTSIDDLFKKDISVDDRQLFKLIRAVFFQIVNGLNELHKLEFIHKDLKPQNILISHDGRILIADFGLTTYLVCGNSTPQKFYYKPTTPTIEPPEGNNASEKSSISKSYDIWSLGCVLDFLMYGNMKFDMWKNGDDYRDNVTLSDYAEKLEKLHTGYDPAKIKNLSETAIELLPKYGDLIKGLLDVDPTKRLTTEKILQNPLFEGLTINEAIKDVREILEQETSGKSTSNTRKIGNRGRNKIISNTVKDLNNDKKNNSFFQIKSLEKPPTEISENLQVDEAYKLRPSFVLINFHINANNAYSIYSILHAIELHNRYAYIIQKDAKDISLALIKIACKISPYDSDKQIAGKFARYDDSDIKEEIAIINALHGDMLPQVGGLVDIVMKEIIDKSDEEKKRLLTQFFVNFAKTNKSLKECVLDEVNKDHVLALGASVISKFLNSRIKFLPKPSTEQMVQRQINSGVL